MRTVQLQRVPEKDKAVLAKLLYGYQKELLSYSGGQPEDVETYKYLPSYFSEPDRAAFFILIDGEIGGFVLVNTHTILAKDAHAIAEFYIVPTFRRNGVGVRAATLVFKKFPGLWEVAEMETNLPAIHFWRKTISAFTNGHYTETFVDNDIWHGPVQIFRA